MGRPRPPERPRYRKRTDPKKRAQRSIDIGKFRMLARRELYEVLRLENNGKVPCFCCGEHVPEWDATLEHVKPLSRGGGDHIGNYAISHTECNKARGAPEVTP